MNKSFLWYWIPFTVVMASIAIYRYLENQNLVIAFSCVGLFGLIMIIEIIRKHKDFHFTKNELTIKQTFRSPKNIDLNSIESWKEINYYYTLLQSEKSLILKTYSGQKITLTDKDNEKEYYKLFQYLRINLTDKINKNQLPTMWKK